MIWKSAAKGRLNNELLYYFFWAKKLEIMHMISYREDSTYYIYSHLCPDYGHLHIFWTLHDQHGLIHASLIVRVKASIGIFWIKKSHFATLLDISVVGVRQVTDLSKCSTVVAILLTIITLFQSHNCTVYPAPAPHHSITFNI